MPNCYNCGSEVGDNASFCQSCGRKIENSNTAQTPPSVITSQTTSNQTSSGYINPEKTAPPSSPIVGYASYKTSLSSSGQSKLWLILFIIALIILVPVSLILWVNYSNISSRLNNTKITLSSTQTQLTSVQTQLTSVQTQLTSAQSQLGVMQSKYPAKNFGSYSNMTSWMNSLPSNLSNWNGGISAALTRQTQAAKDGYIWSVSFDSSTGYYVEEAVASGILYSIDATGVPYVEEVVN
jgi:hypothetical protein